MKGPIKPFLFLFSLVLGIFVMRHAGVSVGTIVTRALQNYRPSDTICKGTELNDVFSQSEIDRANSFKASLEGMRGGNPFLTTVLSGNFIDQIGDYALGLIPMVAPWAAFFLISFIAAIVVVCNWCCMYGCCKNCKCCKCCKEPKTSSRKRIYIVISAIFLLGNFGAGIAGVIIAGGVPKGMELMICSLISVMEDLAYGIPEDKWLGVAPIVTNLGVLSDNINSAITTLSAINTSPISKTAIHTKITDMKTNLDVAANKNVPRAAPDETSTYIPTYIANVGPESDESKMTGMIKKEVDILYDLINGALVPVDDAVTALKTQPIATDITTASSSISGYSDTVQDLLRGVGDFGEIGKTAISGVGAGLTAIFAASIAFAVFALGSMILVGLMKIKSFNKFLHTTWMAFTIFAILGFLLSTALYPLTVVLMELCGVLEVTLPDPDSDKDSRSTLQQFLSGMGLEGEVKDLVEYCLNDAPGANTDLMTFFNLDTVLEDFNTIYSNFNEITAIMPFDTTVPESITLRFQTEMVGKIKSGEWADSTETATDLAALNSVSNHNNYACTTVYDNWRLNSANCTSSDGTKFTSSDGDTANRGNPTCIGLDQWTTPAHDINNRYTSSEYGTCGNKGNNNDPALTYARNFITKFKTNRGAVNTIFTSVENELGTVKTQFENDLQTVLNDFKAVNTALTDVHDVLNGERNGILRNLHCKFMQTVMRRMRLSMCTGFISSLYQTSVVIIIVSFMSLFSAIFVFCLAKRFVVEEPQGRAKPI